ncbi:FAD-dependent monooxygenase [Kutzneria kofuensis]|uniref:2-polyprenyl-6-methoxyphenol hydroxylase-like FAD-dependent oxidoreductase n=1 Tax=Kutzneria kofuensis TaxID=103725 RepID=A0A7W9NFZ9_9PSEU|nr:FAD-dependent monooxygenase [Kutzneria kofuensis]MBB5892012.1 2-polyprenyl-6-methoxyphenol hydroxylase-like FAD-dependent oxidoreductase [Kutzneria kofuensis]
MTVLVVGAGPTGLALGVDLARRGVPVRVIDKAPEHFPGSRGKGIQDRTLEVLADLGIRDAVLAEGRHTTMRVYVNREFSHQVESGSLITPQWKLEEALRDKLAEHGVKVELNTELLDLDGTTSRGKIDADYIVGCDGGRSTVRKLLGVPFEGVSSDGSQVMLLGDAEVSGLDAGCGHMWTGQGLYALTPFRTVPQWQVQIVSAATATMEPSLESFQRLFDDMVGLPGVKLSNPTWLSTYRVNIRMVRKFRVGNVFLAGDAAHVHPPAGGLGLNTGIQDSYNLGWKLAAVINGEAGDALLDTYELERRPIAEWTLGTSSEGLRKITAAMANGTGAIEAAASPEHKQLGLGYPDSPLSRNLVDWDGPKAGFRAPWQESLRRQDFTLLTFDDVRVLVRPDGYIGVVGGPGDDLSVPTYLMDK